MTGPDAKQYEVHLEVAGMVPFAHSKNSDGVRDDLAKHLETVARLSGHFGARFGASDLAYWVGLWHDLGKFHPDFQSYLANPVARRGPDHKAAGALLAARWLDPLAFLIQGHHGGLTSSMNLRIWLREKLRESRPEEALRIARREMAGFEWSWPWPC